MIDKLRAKEETVGFEAILLEKDSHYGKLSEQQS